MKATDVLSLIDEAIEESARYGERPLRWRIPEEWALTLLVYLGIFARIERAGFLIHRSIGMVHVRADNRLMSHALPDVEAVASPS